MAAASYGRSRTTATVVPRGSSTSRGTAIWGSNIRTDKQVNTRIAHCLTLRRRGIA